MKVRMKRTTIGSPNGISVLTYEEGKEYDIPESLFDIFHYQMGIVEPISKEVVEQKTADTEERKITAFVEGPENKEEKTHKRSKK